MAARKHRPAIEQFKYHCRWLPVPGWPGYVVSEDGRVWSGKTNGEWREIGNNKPATNGYWMVRLVDENRDHYCTVQEIVMLAFAGPRPKGLQIRHLNGDRLDNRRENLAYGTPKENAFDRWAHGTQPYGEGHQNTSFSDEDVMEIRRLKASGVSGAVISKRYGISTGAVTNITKGKHWKHLPLIPYANLAVKHSDETVRDIIVRRSKGESIRSIAESVNILQRTVRMYADGKLRKKLYDSVMQEIGSP